MGIIEMTQVSKHIPYTEIAKRLPISKGEIIYVFSDILGLVKGCRANDERFEVEEFIKTLQEAVGEDGTLIFPLVNFDFCKGVPFNYHKTKGKAGALGEAARKMNGFKRTKHPMYSFAVWGAAQDELVAMENKSGLSEDSPFGYMYRNGAKMLTVELVNRIGSFKHYIEQAIGVDYRFHKNFTAMYTDEAGSTEERTYSAYVRDWDVISPERIANTAIVEVMSVLGINNRVNINNVPFSITNLQGMYEAVSLELRYNRGRNMYLFIEKGLPAQ
jgi:aminoglycoside 3-N-acetyltransferase